MRSAAVERHLERLRERRAEDDRADRRRLVVDVARPRVQAAVVEGIRADEPDLLLRREQQLDAGVRAALGEHAPRRLEHDGDGGLVVGAENRAGAVANDAVLDHRLDRSGRRHRVQVRTEEERLALGARLDPGVEIPDLRARLRAGVVLVDLEAAVAEIRGDHVCDGALLAGRARERGELQEEREDVGGHGG